MSQLSISLITFKKKIEEAVVLVPTMIAEEKLKAVQFWNVVSERLQEIVNNSAADINALAMRLDPEDGQQSQQLLPQPLHQNEKQTTQSTVPLMDTMQIIDGSSDDKQELYLQMNSHSNSHQNLINDNSIISNNSSNHMTQDIGQTVTNSGTEDEIDEHLASVITSYHESHETHPNHIQESSQQMLIAFEKNPKESQEVFQHFTQQPIIDNRNSFELNSTSATTSVIQEVDQNITSSRRNVIQSTQRAIEAIEKNLKNCCNDFENNNNINSDNTCDETMNCNNNVIKVIETTDESQGESSANHIFNETSFDVSSYSSSEESQQKQFRIDDNISENTTTDENKKDGIKKKSKPNNKTKTSDNKTKSLFECDICHKVLPNNSALVTHKWIHSKPYSCGECDARFSTKGNLLVHQRRHTGEKPFACDRCPASFSTKGNLKRHIKAHSGERPWKCSQCDSRFTEKKSLKVHMRRHTGEKPYQCSVCGKSFSQTGVLQTHMALHLDERKHLCELCGKAFRQRSQLRLHVLRHEGVKRWDCSDCAAKFLTKGDLERHHRVHTGERPFVCDLCGKTFTRQQSLNEHSNRHYGLKPYACTVCTKTFAEMSACYKHIKVHKKHELNAKNNESIDKTTTKPKINTIGRQLAKIENKTNSDLRNTRSQVNVIQSTASSVVQTRCEPIDGNIIASIDDSVVSCVSGNSNNNSIEYVDFAAINLLVNTSTKQQNL